MKKSRKHKELPSPKVRAVLTKSGLWRSSIKKVESYTEPFTVRLPKDYLAEAGIVDPINSFKVSLSRYVARHSLKLQVYVVDGVIYVTRQTKSLAAKSLKRTGE